MSLSLSLSLSLIIVGKLLQKVLHYWLNMNERQTLYVDGTCYWDFKADMPETTPESIIKYYTYYTTLYIFHAAYIRRENTVLHNWE